MKDYNIRHEIEAEQREVENLVRDSFWNVYRPGCLEHYVLHCLRDDEAFVPQLDYVMTIMTSGVEVLIGQVVCMKAEIQTDSGARVPIMTFGPISIHPNYKRQGYGKALLDYTMAKATEMGFGAVCIEGNIDFYGKSGFAYASSYGIRYHGLPKGTDASFFLCKELKAGYLSGVTGEYATPRGYFVDQSKCEIFDEQFPKKQKQVLLGQLW